MWPNTGDSAGGVTVRNSDPHGQGGGLQEFILSVFIHVAILWQVFPAIQIKTSSKINSVACKNCSEGELCSCPNGIELRIVHRMRSAGGAEYWQWVCSVLRRAGVKQP